MKLKEKIIVDDKLFIDIRREFVLTDFMKEMKKPRFSPLQVCFLFEP